MRAVQKQTLKSPKSASKGSILKVFLEGKRNRDMTALMEIGVLKNNDFLWFVCFLAQETFWKWHNDNKYYGFFLLDYDSIQLLKNNAIYEFDFACQEKSNPFP